MILVHLKETIMYSHINTFFDEFIPDYYAK